MTHFSQNAYLNVFSPIQDVVKNHKRPAIGKILHPEYASLTTRCWAHSPVSRPAFKDLPGLLQQARVDIFLKDFPSYAELWKSTWITEYQVLISFRLFILTDLRSTSENLVKLFFPNAIVFTMITQSNYSRELVVPYYPMNVNSSTVKIWSIWKDFAIF